MIHAIMFDNITVAKGYEDNGTRRFKLVDNLPLFFVPRDLFMGRDTVSIYEVGKWLETRIFPENRIGVRSLLRSMGLKRYDALEIALKTRACLVEDGWWVALTENDTFRELTIRGVLGKPELRLENYL